MQTIASRLLIVLVAFGVGVACWRLTNLFSQRRITLVERSVRHTALWPAARFKLVDRSCESGCVETYETPGGQQVSFTYACFSGSAPDALRDMENLIDQGTVVQRQRETERQGTTERAVVLFPKDETGERPAEIFSYHYGDTCFQSIHAGSLELALEFERSGIPNEFLTRTWE